jgi:hypothetical protein
MVERVAEVAHAVATHLKRIAAVSAAQPTAAAAAA